MSSDQVDRLYGLSPSEFTPARDALAKELRAAGDKDAAAAVKALRKPSAAAWAINAAARRDPDALQALLDAGEALRAAQERLLAGAGDRTELRRAGEDERAAIATMTAAAAAAAREAGQALSASVETRVRETLHAAALHDEVRAAIAAGRLEKEAEASGFAGAGAFAAPPAPAARPTKARKAAEPEPGDQAPQRGTRTAEQRREAKATAERLRKAREAARAGLSEANRRLREAERAADVASRRLERAEAAIEDARRRLAEAEERERAERDACAEAQRELRAAKAAAASAQSAVDAAEA